MKLEDLAPMEAFVAMEAPTAAEALAVYNQLKDQDSAKMDIWNLAALLRASNILLSTTE